MRHHLALSTLPDASRTMPGIWVSTRQGKQASKRPPRIETGRATSIRDAGKFNLVGRQFLSCWTGRPRVQQDAQMRKQMGRQARVSGRAGMRQQPGGIAGWHGRAGRKCGQAGGSLRADESGAKAADLSEIRPSGLLRGRLVGQARQRYLVRLASPQVPQNSGQPRTRESLRVSGTH
jgi:hypothetical protein